MSSSSLEQQEAHLPDEKSIQDPAQQHQPVTRIASTADAPPPPPDGGLTAWLQVLCSHLILINTWGFTTSFGIFQAYYVETLKRPPSDISWVGSFEIFLIYFVGTFSGRAVDMGYLRPTLALGLTLLLVGVFTTSVATQYWQLFLAQGICQGIGNGLLFCPAIALVSTYFAKKRVFALAGQASGAATGGMIFPAIAQTLLPKIGFGWTVRVMGFVMLFNSILVMVLVKPRKFNKKNGPFIDWSAFREAPYVLYTAGSFLTLWGVYFAYFYVRPYARDILQVSQYTSFSYLLLLNGVGIPGRLIPALLADRYTGPVNMFIATICAAGTLLLCWIAVSSQKEMWAFVAIYGYFGAGVQMLFPAALSSLTTDLTKIGVRVGMAFTIVSLASLSGPPLAGALIQDRNGSYVGAQVFGGISMISGAMFLIGARTAKVGFNIKRRM